ncbi:MAG: cytochrome C oxidase subunit IV family protein [Deltaproteobacteria bacterium]|nr:cytochrome C oxidase subunit IV family protein [Deltaproteobacteria bacterium]
MAHQTTHSEAHGHHVLPLKVYFGVYGALLVLTVVTVMVSYMDLGSSAIVVALVVAIVKAAFVALYFMHLRYDDRFNGLVFLSSVLFLMLFFAFTFIDLTSRGYLIPEEGNFTLRNEQKAAQASEAPAEPAAGEAPAHH